MEFNKELVRLSTFAYWNVPFISKRKLAMLGFFYIGPFDFVRCQFCGVEIGMWEEGDDILTEHQRWSPYCRFIKQRPTNNVPLDAELLERTLSNSGLSYINSENMSISELKENTSKININLNLKTEPIKKPEFPEFSLECHRLKTFEDWPKFLKPTPKELCDSGFFYTGKGDRVACFFCGGGIKDWIGNEIPWEFHAALYKHCDYVRIIKGENFIIQAEESMKIRRKQSTNENIIDISVDENKIPKEIEKIHNDCSKLCKICYENEMDIAFYPCCHVVSCGKCGISCSECPYCRQTFTHILKLYFS